MQIPKYEHSHHSVSNACLYLSTLLLFTTPWQGETKNLQLRIKELHKQELIIDHELCGCEDTVADLIDLESCFGKLSTNIVLKHHAGKDVCKLVALLQRCIQMPHLRASLS